MQEYTKRSIKARKRARLQKRIRSALRATGIVLSSVSLVALLSLKDIKTKDPQDPEVIKSKIENYLNMNFPTAAEDYLPKLEGTRYESLIPLYQKQIDIERSTRFFDSGYPDINSKNSI